MKVLNKILRVAAKSRLFRRLIISKSETSKCRSRLARFCVGNGLDLGFGGDPITIGAIRVDLPSPYAAVGKFPVQLAGDASNLYWFNTSCLDFVYSSHLLEDYNDTEAILREWMRVIKPGGTLVIFCPDEQLYRRHCENTGQQYNTHHKHSDFSLSKVKTIINSIGNITILHEASPMDKYSWELVCRKED